MHLLRSIRETIEGRIFGSLCQRAPAGRREALGRTGLRELRELWWTPLQFETTGALWRQVLLVESSPEPQPGEAAFPERARVVVYTPGHVGDVLHAAPLLRALRASRPRAHLRWLVGPWCIDLARRSRAADEVEAFSPAWYQYRRGGGGPGLREQMAWGRAQQPIDVFLSTAATDLCALFVGRSMRPSWWCGRALQSSWYPVAPREDIQPIERDRYEAEDILQIAAPLGITMPAADLACEVSDDERAAAAEQLAALGIAPTTPYVVIAPAAGWPGKQWPVDRWAAVADELHLMGCSVLFGGTKAESAVVASVQARMKAPSVSLAGRTSLAQLAAVLAGARLWLGSDSGGLHLAAAVGTPTVSLFGPTNPAKWAPRGDRHVALRGGAGCPACVPWHPRARCAEDGACMKKIAVDDVRAAAGRLLERHLPRGSKA